MVLSFLFLHFLAIPTQQLSIHQIKPGRLIPTAGAWLRLILLVG